MGSGISSSYSGAGGSQPYANTYHVVQKELNKDKKDPDIYKPSTGYFKNPTATNLEKAAQNGSVYIGGNKANGQYTYVMDQNGEIIMEEKQIKIPRFKVVTVFDVSQTYGEPLPQLASDLTGDVQQFDVFMEALKRSAPVPLETQPLASNMDGYFSPTEQKIVLREGMSEVQTICAAIHEIAHSKLHNKNAVPDEQYDTVDLFDKPGLFSNGRIDRNTLPDGLYAYDLRGSDDDPGDPIAVEEKVVVNHAGTVILGEPLALGEDGRLMLDDNLNFAGEFGGDTISLREFWEQVCPDKAHKSQRTQEVEAESIAYAVSAYYGIETGENSFGYIASWSSGQDMKELKASLETISRTADGLINDIDKQCALIYKERGMEKEQQAEPKLNEALFLIDDSAYIHVQRNAENHDYTFTFYDADTLMRLYGGETALPEDSYLIGAPLITVAEDILTEQSVTYAKLEPIALTRLHDLLEENAPAKDAGEFKQPEPVREPGKLDEYPMPDPTVDPKQFEKAGVDDEDLLPISRAHALELMAEDYPVYSVVAGDIALCMDTDEIGRYSDAAMFGIDRKEWEESEHFQKAIEARLDHQEEREAAFLSHPDSFAIYQMDHDLDSIPLRFSSYDELMQRDMAPTRDMYDLIYTAELENRSLDNIFEEFNMARPADYQSYSLSASDIIALNQGGAVSYHYVDRFGFKELPDFVADNPLKNVEMSVEDDYNMLDGIINNGPRQPTVEELEQQAKSGQPISLMDLADAIQREKEKPAEEAKPKRMSIYEQLRQPVPQQPTAPKVAKKHQQER